MNLLQQKYTQENIFLDACASLGKAYPESRILVQLQDCSSAVEVITTGSHMAIYGVDDHEYVTVFLAKPDFRIQYQYKALSIIIRINIQDFTEEHLKFCSTITIHIPDDEFSEFPCLDQEEYQEILQGKW